jgi:hypothetical protein
MISLEDITAAFNNASEESKQAYVNATSQYMLKAPGFIIGLVKNNTFITALSRSANLSISLTGSQRFQDDVKKITLECLEEEHIIDKLEELPEQINELEDRIQNIRINAKVITPASDETEKIIINSKKSYVAYKAIEFMSSLPDDIKGEKTLTNKLWHAVCDTIPEELKPKNLRQSKPDIFKCATDWFGLKKDRAPRGNHDSVLIMTRDFDNSILNRIEVSV